MKNIAINKDILAQFYCGSNESMQEVFTEFLSRFSQIRSDITNGFISRSWVELKRILHSNGPSFMYVGLPEVSVLFKKLELQCDEHTAKPVSDADFVLLMQLIDSAYKTVSAEAKNIEAMISSAA